MGGLSWILGCVQCYQKGPYKLKKGGRRVRFRDGTMTMEAEIWTDMITECEDERKP